MELSQTPNGNPQPLQCAIIDIFLWLLLFLLPSEGGLFDGIPIGPVEALGLALVVWIAAHRVRPAGSLLAGAAAVAALVASLAVPGEPGLHARYFAGGSASAQHERSTEFADPNFTRIDARLSFSPGSRDFPLSFFNDHTRFNFIGPGQPDRRKLSFAAVWSGWVWTTAGTHTFFLQSPGAAAQLAIDSSPIASATAESPNATADVALAAGWHRLYISLSSPYGAPRDFAAGEMSNGVRQPFDGGSTRTERIDARQRFVARMLRIIKPMLDLVTMAWLGIIAGLLLTRHLGELCQQGLAARRAALHVFIAATTIEALRFAWPWAERLRIMVAGDDTMVYEAYARDILLHGLLMNQGAPLGQGEPFYYQAFYPYFLAATHAVFGENVFGALFVQRCLVAATALALARVAMLVGGTSIWPTALGVAAGVVYWKLAPISRDLLSESLYVPLLAWWALATIELGERPTVRRAAIAGGTGGFTAITRSTVLLAWPFVWAAVCRRLRRAPRRAHLIGVLVTLSLTVFSLIAVRNALVSHRFVPMPTEFGITLRGGNEPPGDLVLRLESRQWLYDMIGADGHTVEVLEYALDRPAAFSRNMWNKVLFVLGFYDSYAPGWGYSPVYIAIWIGGLAGAVLLARRGALTSTAAIPLMIALTQFVALVVVYPKGERLIVPIHTLLVPYAAVTADHLLRAVIRPAMTSAAPTRPAPPLSQA